MQQTTADKLRALLQAKQWTVSHCAQMTGVSESTISRILNNRGGETNMSTLRTLAEGLGVQPNDLIASQPAEEKPEPERTNVHPEGLEMLRSHYENMLTVIQEQYDRTITAIEGSRKRAQRRAVVWATVAFFLLVAAGIVTGSYFRFRWDVAHPTIGNIQYSSIAELREILGYGE